MGQVYVKIQDGDVRACVVAETSRTAQQLDRELRPLLKDGVELTCLRREGASQYGWAQDAEQ
jgi:hypothetical protein